MALDSLDCQWKNGQRIKPRIYVLEIRNKKTPTNDPIAWLLVERQEIYKYKQDGSVLQASLRLSYERITAEQYYRQADKGHFCAGYWRDFTDSPHVSLISESSAEGAVYLDLPCLEGQLIGTYLMNEIVLWVRQWPNATVSPIKLLAGQAHGENKARRNQLYEQFSLVFDYHDPEKCTGFSMPMLVEELTPVETWKNSIFERDVREYLCKVLYERDQLALKLSQLEYTFKQQSIEMGHAMANPAWWALHQLREKIAERLIAAAFLLILIVLIWKKLN